MLLELQNTILKMIAQGETLDASLQTLCHEIECILPDAIVTVLALDKAGRLHPIAAPSLPGSYSQALDGVEIGIQSGSCGAAAYFKKSIITVDISTDLRWEKYKELALPLGITACWSSPIFGTTSEVIGTLALYFKERRAPTVLEQSIVEGCLPLCTVALEHNERLQTERRLALTDVSTGLTNRAGFIHASQSDTGRPLTLLLIDIDNLKFVNDTFGHAAGDELIAIVARRLVSALPSMEIYRLGGDEFAVRINGITRKDLKLLLKNVIQKVIEPARCHGNVISPSVTIGAAKRIHRKQPTDELYFQADLSLHHAKEVCRGNFVIFDKTTSTAISKRREAVRMVLTALQENHIEAWYQPIIRIGTHEIFGVEALARIRTRDGLILSASQFHEATTDVQVASALTKRMIDLIARDTSMWSEAGIEFSHIGINISVIDLRRGEVNRLLKSSFTNYGLPLESVVLELTESFFIGSNDTQMSTEIEALRAMGVKVALDDFGTGFASLTHLLTVPIDIIKIDKSFVDRIGSEVRGSGIVEGILHIAKSLCIECIAEGVETRDQALKLQQMGCLYGQGFLYSKAVPASEILSASMKTNLGSI
ncbi:bifunctional diguanylate cyclase/phosphodiesterase [Brucella pituitosa]|uniref:bifunctional diguanylate cyclase/phosphodiesterase n=1 Tax=Brucella pituitosa TaxID=571256 RepID=UPI003F4AC008